MGERQDKKEGRRGKATDMDGWDGLFLISAGVVISGPRGGVQLFFSEVRSKWSVGGVA